jgi:hypothetical protein
MNRKKDMTREQVSYLVAYLNRAGLVIAVEGQAAVWHDALWGIRYEDALEACRQLARRPGGSRFMVPGDLLVEVRKVRNARIGNRVPPAPPDELPAEAQAEFGRAYLRALGDGLTETQADQAACAVAGVVRDRVGPADPGRLRALLAGVLKDAG